MTDLRLSAASVDVDDDEWRELALETGNVFATQEWVATWWRHFGGGRRLLATACRGEDGRLIGVLPLYEWRGRPLRVLRFLGHGPGDALGPICRSGDRPAVAAAFARGLGEWNADLVVGENIPADEGWSHLLDARVVEEEGSPVLTLNGASWESLLASWSKNLRSQVRSRERKLGKEHELHFRLADDPARLPRDLDRLFVLHRGRWPEGSGFSQAERFHRDFAAVAFERGWLRLWLLEIDGEARAAWYGLRFANVESYYQAGRDAAWDEYRIGFVLLAHTIREAAEDGAREYRFLRGGEEFKYRFASYDPKLETFLLPRGRRGRASVRLALGLPKPILRRVAGG